jgi:hypothetical protein
MPAARLPTNQTMRWIEVTTVGAIGTLVVGPGQ